MNIFVIQDRQHYRRWINVLVSLLLPGTGHFLTGRKMAAVGWLLAYLLSAAMQLWFMVWPGSDYLLGDFGFPDGLRLALQLVVAADSCRRPMPRLRFSRWAGLVAVLVAINLGPALILVHFLVRPYVNPTGAMQPTLQGTLRTADGQTTGPDRVFVNRFIYRVSEPQRGDIVVFRTRGIEHPAVPRDQYYVKRVVALPGEQVRIAPPYVFINGQPLQAPPIFAKIAQKRDGHTGYVAAQRFANETDEVTLGADEYLVLGDNGLNSLDSRYFGPIRRQSIIGKVFYRYAPAGRKGWVE